MMNGLMSRVLSAPDSPSADLYFLNACGDFLKHGVERLAPTVFRSAETCLIVRHSLRLSRMPQQCRLVYLVDDDVAAGLSDQSLPYFYRQKLRMVEGPASRRLVPQAADIVVSSPRLEQMFAGARTHLLLPHWSDPFADLDHHSAMREGGGWVDIAYLGSIVHSNDLAFLLPVIEHVLWNHPQVRFHIPERHVLPERLDNHARVVRIPGIGWTAYRRALRIRRFHLALYPLLDTPFNRGRSVNKLIEHAVVGAAPIYSRDWAEARRISDRRNGLLVGNSVEDWVGGIELCLANPMLVSAIAAGTQSLGQALNDPAPQRQFWQSMFQLAAPAHA